MALFTRDTQTMIAQALQKITSSTSITATSPGSIARALTEAVVTELGNLYSILDFNFNQFNLSTASGRSLDLIGSLYNINRKTVTDLLTIDRSIGAFYFYIRTPYSSPITIPKGTRVLTDTTTYIGQQFTYVTTDDFTIPVGRTKVYASIVPQFLNSVFTAGANTLTVIDPNFTQPAGATVLCTNPKPIEAQVGQESDDSYRFRIQQAVRTAAGGTLNSVRLAGLNVAGIRDINMVDSAYGLGSFLAVVVPEDNTTVLTVTTQAIVAMEAVRPVGVRMYVLNPNYLPVDVSCTVILNKSNANGTLTASAVQTNIIRFLNKPLVGSPLVYNELIQTILDTDNSILDVTISNLAVNGTQVLLKNYTPDNSSMLIPGAIVVSVAS